MVFPWLIGSCSCKTQTSMCVNVSILVHLIIKLSSIKGTNDTYMMHWCCSTRQSMSVVTNWLQPVGSWSYYWRQVAWCAGNLYPLWCLSRKSCSEWATSSPAQGFCKQCNTQVLQKRHCQSSDKPGLTRQLNCMQATGVSVQVGCIAERQITTIAHTADKLSAASLDKKAHKHLATSAQMYILEWIKDRLRHLLTWWGSSPDAA